MMVIVECGLELIGILLRGPIFRDVFYALDILPRFEILKAQLHEELFVPYCLRPGADHIVSRDCCKTRRGERADARVDVKVYRRSVSIRE